MKIAIAQMNTNPGDFGPTVAMMLAYGDQAANLGCDLVVYPAAALMGPDPQTLVADEAYQLDAALALKRLADALKIDALVPVVSAVGGAARFDVAYISGGAVAPVSLLAGDQSLAAASSAVPAGMPAATAQPFPAPTDVAQLIEPCVINAGGVDVGIALSAADLEVYADGDLNADVICLMPVDGYNADDEQTCLAPSVSDGCFVEDVADANAWLVAAGAAGAYDDMVYVGGSFVMAPWGELAAVAPSCSEDLLTCEFDVLDEGPLASPVTTPAYDRAAMMWEALAASVRDQVTKRNLPGVALVVDGTLTSAATAALAVDAVGPLRVSALVSAADDAALKDARALVRNLRIRDVDEVSARDLDRAAAALGGDDAAGLVSALLEVRLGALAVSEDLLALSCADKTELAVGQGSGSGVFSPHERACVRATAFAPFGDVYRSDVARLARWRNTVSPVIGTGCLSRLCIPDDLGLEQVATSDEARLSELDALLLLRIERQVGAAELAATRLGETGALMVLARLRLREATRRQAPLYPVVSARSLAETSRPVASAWADHAVRDEDLAELQASAMPGATPTVPSRLSGQQGRTGSAGPGPGAASTAGSFASGAATVPAGPDFSVPDELKEQMGPRAAELMGYLKELSDGRRLRGEQGKPGKGGAGPWMGGMFSDN